MTRLALIPAYAVAFIPAFRRLGLFRKSRHTSSGTFGGAEKFGFLEEPLGSEFLTFWEVRISISLEPFSGGQSGGFPPDNALSSALFSALRSRSQARRLSAVVSALDSAVSSTRMQASSDSPSSRIALSVAMLKLTALDTVRVEQ